ncbi:hypothetical protein AB0P21_09680 [Kribbella sp. NPDC056861]|uniref:hypothetical protein n=1 Tax=Kribbella sp. NPDC056861 TaxID=3154857 RepID=UPI00341EBF01
MADVTCAHCGEPWDAHHLRHDMSWYQCQDCKRTVVKHTDGSWQTKGRPWEGSPGNCTHPLGGVLHWDDSYAEGTPDEVAASTDPQAWFTVVIAGRGCPDCGVVGERPDTEHGEANLMALLDSAVFDGDPTEYL